ncbi:hypothetical protein HPB49_019542 [Dermacentor silvarum]|uniref:Uncharacterized protein n=1 Tax=Dermacentor silvarum TaxID=543639 RepID=A0ACB8CSV1_DERSI|nr:hypothetical protein HPB49_019542 [Dermacentor silvarum]
MPVEVEGETIEEEEFNDAGWNFVRGKSSKQGTAGCEPDAGSRRYGGGFGAPSQRSRSTLKKRVIASSRMPDLPEDHRRIVIRPRDGLDLRKAGHCKVAEAIMAAAKITYDAAGEDVVCPNNYVCIKQIKVGEKVYNVNAYYSAGDGYCKGVIRNVDREITEKELNTMIMHSRNPTAMQAKRIKDSGTVVIVFEDCEVPNYIKFGRVLLKCYLYRRQVEPMYVIEPMYVRRRRRKSVVDAGWKIPQTHTSVKRSASYAERVTLRGIELVHSVIRLLSSCDSDEENGLKSQDGNDNLPGNFKILLPSRSGETNGGARPLLFARSRLVLGHDPSQDLVISRRKQHGRRRLVA